MTDTYSIPLALVDFIPNIAFLIGAFFLTRIVLLEKMRTDGFILTVGAILVFLGGSLKAIWKLLYSAGVADLTLLSEAQFILLAPGFLAMLIPVIRLAQGKVQATSTVLPAMAIWKIPLLVVMTLCSLGVQGILTHLAFKRGVRLAGYGFAVSAIGIVTMAVMASGEQTIVRQWIEEGVNTIGQSGFMLGSFWLYKDFATRIPHGQIHR